MYPKLNTMHLIKTVKLKFFLDDASGEWGLTHEDTIDPNNSFNAFWNGIGIFHDVFEHSHEYTKYFRGDYAMNIGGEMAAMGAMWYYFEVLGMYNRLDTNGYSFRSPGESMRETTLSLVKESVYYGYCNYGSTLESNVPKQRPVDNSELEYQIAEFWRDIKDSHYKDSKENEQEMESANEYKQSVSFRKIADLHRYGFRMAARLIPDTDHNRNILTEFMEYWDNLCKDNKAEEMAQMFRGLTIKLYKDGDEISWKGIFHSADTYEIKDVTVRPNMKFDKYDAMKHVEY